LFNPKEKSQDAGTRSLGMQGISSKVRGEGRVGWENVGSTARGVGDKR